MDKKTYLTKIEIATYLRDYTRLMAYASLSPTVNFSDLFKKMMKDDNRLQYAFQEYYHDMINIYSFFLANKIYSVLNDISFNYLLEKNIDSVTISEDIFVNRSDFNRFSKKQIIKFIRNAINHNDKDGQELYKLYRDGRDIKIEIFLKNTKPIPFHIVMNINEYILIMSNLELSNKLDAIVFKSTQPLDFSHGNFYESLNGAFFRKYYINEKVPKEVLLKIKDEFKINQSSSIIGENLPSEAISYIDYRLTIAQKLKVQEDLIEWYRTIGISPYDSIDYVWQNVIPLGIAKLHTMDFNMIVADYYVKGNKSLRTIAQDIMKPNEKPIIWHVSKYGNNVNLLCNAYDFDGMAQLSSSIYYSYLFDTLITDNKVKLGECEYPREKIRNSFVHSRCFVGIKGCFKLFDCDNGEKNDLNHNWSASIPLKNMTLSAEQYYQECLSDSRLENERFFDYPIVVRIDEKTNTPFSITFIKNSKTYIYNLNVNKYSDEFLPWGLYIAEGNRRRFVDNIEEAKTFFDELTNLSLEDKRDFAPLIKVLYEQYLKCIQYKRGTLPLEELKKYDSIVLKCKFEDEFKKTLN